jgi:hypothetical protein
MNPHPISPRYILTVSSHLKVFSPKSDIHLNRMRCVEQNGCTRGILKIHAQFWLEYPKGRGTYDEMEG